MASFANLPFVRGAPDRSRPLRQCGGKPGLLRARQRRRLPIKGPVHHLPHPLKPPVRPALPPRMLGCRRTLLSAFETQFQLSIYHHMYPFFAQNHRRGGGTKAVQPYKYGYRNSFNGCAIMNQSCYLPARVRTLQCQGPTQNRLPATRQTLKCSWCAASSRKASLAFSQQA